MFVSLSLENRLQELHKIWNFFSLICIYPELILPSCREEKDKKLFWLKTLCKDWSWKGGH